MEKVLENSYPWIRVQRQMSCRQALYRWKGIAFCVVSKNETTFFLSKKKCYTWLLNNVF